MNRRDFLRMTTATGAGLLMPQLHTAMAAREKYGQRKPNILLIVSEDNGPQLSCYGDRCVKTPNLDKLAAEGVRFESAFVTHASCSPSRSSIFTSLYPHQNGQIGLASHKYSMHSKCPNIPSLLKKEGYRTGIIGKIHVNPQSAFPFDFNRKHTFTRDVRKIAAVANEFITTSDEPFFLMVNYLDAHIKFINQQDGIPEKPLGPDDVKTPPFVGIDTPMARKSVAGYYNSISRLDTGIGMLLELLAKAGHSENTLIIYLSDHGPQLSRCKTSCYESGLKIPFIVRWPRQAKEGLVRSEMVSTVDILPTILDAVGAETPAGLAGRSILPLIKGKTVPWREYLFGEFTAHGAMIYFPQRSVRDRRYKLIVNLLQDRPSPSLAYWVRLKIDVTDASLATASAEVRRAYDIFHNPPTEELYDLEKDPYEFNNLAGKPEYAAIQERLRVWLKSWQKQTNDPLTDPAKLAKLTKEHDGLDKNFMKDKTFKWKYHGYLFRK